MFGEFASLLGPLARIPGGGELLQWWSAWTVFAVSMLGLSYAMIRLCLMSENPVIPMLVLATLQPLYLVLGLLQGRHPSQRHSRSTRCLEGAQLGRWRWPTT